MPWPMPHTRSAQIAVNASVRTMCAGVVGIMTAAKLWRRRQLPPKLLLVPGLSAIYSMLAVAERLEILGGDLRGNG